MGFYGRGNFGDDLMCSALIRFVAENTAMTVRVVSSNTATFDDSRDSRVEVVHRSVFSVLRSLRQSQIFCQGGGTIFHDSYTGSALLKYYVNLGMWAVLFWVARLQGVKVIVIGAGIGPLRHRPSRWISRLALLACKSIGVRDDSSAQTLQQLGRRFRCEVGFDLAALYCSKKLPVERRVRNGPRVLAISARSLTEFLNSQKLNVEYWSSLADALAIFHREQPIRVVLMSVFTGSSSVSDEAASDIIASRLPGDIPVERRAYRGSVEALAAEFDRYDWFLCTRFHAAMAAYLGGRELAVVTYNRKVSDLADEIHLPSDRRVPADAPQSVETWLSVLRSLAKDDVRPQLLDRREAERRARSATLRVLETVGAALQ